LWEPHFRFQHLDQQDSENDSAKKAGLLLEGFALRTRLELWRVKPAAGSLQRLSRKEDAFLDKDFLALTKAIGLDLALGTVVHHICEKQPSAAM
jgi:hypothetical protein